MILDYISKFPDPYIPTDQQVTLISKIEAAFKSGKKFVICNAATGCGKSHVAKTIANNSKLISPKLKELIENYNAFSQDGFSNYIHAEDCLKEGSHGTMILTVTKALQDQYQNIFSDANLIKGKSNYICDVDDNYDVETAPCVYVPRLKGECWSANRCHYYNARKKGLTEQCSVLNYKMFASLPKHIKSRDFIICDEASELEEELVKQFSAEILYTKLAYVDIQYKPLLSNDLTEARNWISDVKDSAYLKLKAMQEKIKKNKGAVTLTDKNKYAYLKNLNTSLTQVAESWTDCEYIIDRTADTVIFTPLKVDKLSKAIFDYGKKVLLMSATIVNHKNFAKTLGITDYAYIEMPSGFDPKKSPIHVSTRYKLNYKNIKSLLPQICKDIRVLCDQHKIEKGVIHTHSQEICDVLNDYFSYDDRFLFRKGREKNEHILKLHSETEEPTILVSPSLTHGVDLVGDLARFQIIVKLPYSPLSNSRIKRLFDNDKDWYQSKMLSTLIQTTGRATRNVDDYAVTYILDGNIVDILGKSIDTLPTHFVERFS